VCPNCGKKVTKRKPGGYCPHCDKRIELVRERVNAANVLKYQLIDAPMPQPIDKNDPKSDMIYGISVMETAEGYYVVTIREMVDRIICPKCTKLQMRLLTFADGTEIERKCDRCKATITYRFSVKKNYKIFSNR